MNDAIKTCDEALKVITPTERQLYSDILLIKANALVRLSEHSSNAVKNLKEAIKLCDEILTTIDFSLPVYYLALGTKGNAHLFLARLSIDPEFNLNSAIEAYTRAIEGLAKLQTAPYGIVQILMNRAVAYSVLALYAKDNYVPYLKRSLEDYDVVIKSLSNNVKSQSYNRALVNKALVLIRLAESSPDSHTLLVKSIELCNRALKNLLPTSQNYGRALLCKAEALFKLGKISEAEKVYASAIEVFKNAENWLGLVGANSEIGDIYYKKREL
ncbi:hypothetical protein JCM16307_18450 [Thermococcus prieurii]